MPVEHLFAPAVVIDVSARAAEDREYRLTKQDVEDWEHVHGRVPRRSTVYLRTGWGLRWPDAARYLGDDSNLHFPSYGVEATRLLLDRGVVSLGVDSASIDSIEMLVGSVTTLLGRKDQRTVRSDLRLPVRGSGPCTRGDMIARCVDQRVET